MPRIQPLENSQATGATKATLDAIQSKIGMVPNLIRTAAQSPATLQAYVGISGGLGGSSLTPAVREQIAVLVAQENQCPYCLAAHSAMAKGLGVTEAELLQSRLGVSDDPRTTAILAVASAVNSNRTHFAAEEFTAAKEAGLTDQEILEIVAVVSVNIFTNLLHHVTDAEIEFPLVDLRLPVLA